MKICAVVFLLVTMLGGCSNVDSDDPPELKAAADDVRATTAYKIAAVEAGKELAPDDPAVVETAVVLSEAARYFNTTESDIGNVAYAHVKSAKAAGANVTVKDLLLAGMKAFPPGSPAGKPTLETFNLFGASYRASLKS